MRKWGNRTRDLLVSATVVAGTAVGWSLAFVGHGTAPPIKKQATPGTTSVTPKWLPQGITIVYKGTAQQAEGFPAPLNLGPVNPNPVGKGCPPVGCGAGAVYELQGAPIAIPGDPTFPAMRVTFSPGQYTPVSASSGHGFLVKNVTVGGFAGILSYPDPSQSPDGGSVLLEWVDPRGLHSISTERGYTALTEMFGVSDPDLLKMANSLYG